jgi:hypothetical protein
MKSKNFSLPINPKLSSEFALETLIPFLKQHKDSIFDLYFTCRMPPFEQDAMGDVFVSDPRQTTHDALYISKESGIPLSATFNNIYVRPSQKNLDLFIENFKPLYDKGICIVTLPHTIWVSTGQIQKEFPELYIKNTILREIRQANEIVSLAKAGFNYINLDRDLMRDRNALLEIKEAKDYCKSIGKPVKLSLLVNETCWGGCPIMVEHYHYNNTRSDKDPQFFNDPISRNSCSKWEITDPSHSLKAANLPPWKADWEEFIDLGVDVFKLHGRESMMRLKESMDLIERWDNNEELMFPLFNEYIEDISLQERPIDIWREKIKTCKFDCWKCNYCESVVESRLRKQNRELHPLVENIIKSIDDSANQKDYNLSGLSSNRVRTLLNSICSNSTIKYLEVGAYLGSTFCAAIENNSIEAYAVDNWSTANLKPYENKLTFIETASVDKFKKNVISTKSNSVVKIVNKNCLFVSNQDVPSKINCVFYDGDHEYHQQLASLNAISNLTDDTFVLILDDANFEGVVTSANKFVEQNNYTVLFERKILNDVEDETMWWNGLYILVLQK